MSAVRLWAWHLTLQQSDIDPRSEKDIIANPTLKRRSSAAGSRYLKSWGELFARRLAGRCLPLTQLPHPLPDPMSVKPLAVCCSPAPMSNRVSPGGSGCLRTRLICDLPQFAACIHHPSISPYLTYSAFDGLGHYLGGERLEKGQSCWVPASNHGLFANARTCLGSGCLTI
jgi:hypothetical protein